MSKPASGVHAAQRAASWPKTVAGAAGVLLVGLGVWAMVSPRSFFDTVATFEPYNQHFLQDIGALQIGLGAVLFLALSGRDVLGVTLLGVGIGGAAHAVSHMIGIDLGGRPAVDIPAFTLLAIVLLAAGWTRWNTSAAGP